MGLVNQAGDFYKYMGERLPLWPEGTDGRRQGTGGERV